MLDRFKQFWQGVMLAPFINLFIRLGISPDAVTVVGTLGVSAGALVFFPQGMIWQGVLVITLFVFSDLVDGAMARKMGRTDDFGAFLDSTLDRVADAALFGGLALAILLPLAFTGLGAFVQLWGEKRLRYPITWFRLGRLALSLAFVLVPTIIVSSFPGHHPRDFTDPIYLPAWLTQYDAETGTMPLWGSR